MTAVTFGLYGYLHAHSVFTVNNPDPDSSVTSTLQAGNTALHLASQNDHTDAARLLLLGGSTPRSRNTVRLPSNAPQTLHTTKDGWMRNS